LSSIEIQPLLILPFVENAFKHGIGNQLEKCWIAIDFSANEKEVTIKIENSIITNDNIVKPSENAGIGIENVRNRLNILYRDQYSLKIIPSEDSYLVVLRIPLKYHQISKNEDTPVTTFWE
jgi:sensor histidine kinase YesM